MKVKLVNSQEKQDGRADGRIKILICKHCASPKLKGYCISKAGVKTIEVAYEYYVCFSCVDGD